MSKPPKVSVVMIAYNAPEYIPEAVESILEQDMEGCELIVVDDGSAHDIEAVLAPYKKSLRYIRQDNGGPGKARDTGAAAAQGEYIAFADSDDVHLHYRLGAQSKLLDSFPKAGFVCSDFSTYIDGEITEASTLRTRNLGVDERSLEEALQSEMGEAKLASSLELQVPDNLSQSKIYHGFAPALIAGRHIAWDCASMFRASALKKVGGHDHRLRYWEDWSHTSALSKKYEFVYWDAPVHWYRQHGGQITKQSAKRSAQSYRDVVFRVWKEDQQLRKTHPRLLRKMIKRAVFRNAAYAAEDKEYARARTELFYYMREAPLDRHSYTALVRNVFKQVVLDRLKRV